MLRSKHKCPHLDRPSSTSVDVWRDLGRKRKVSHFYRTSKNIFSFSFPVKYTPISDSLSTDMPQPHLLFRSHFHSFLSFQTALAELNYLFHFSTRNLLMSELTFKIFNRRWYSGNQQSERHPHQLEGISRGKTLCTAVLLCVSTWMLRRSLPYSSRWGLFVPRKQSTHWVLTPKGTVLGSGAFRGWWGHGGGAPRMGLVSS